MYNCRSKSANRQNGFVNYCWIPNHEKLTLSKTQPGTSKIIIHDERFAGYLNLVEQWCHEIEWNDNEDFKFTPICTNKSGKCIAGTLSVAIEEAGQIYFLPKATQDMAYSIELLIDLARNESRAEYSWREHIEIPNLKEIEHKINMEKEKIASIKKMLMI